MKHSEHKWQDTVLADHEMQVQTHRVLHMPRSSAHDSSEPVVSAKVFDLKQHPVLAGRSHLNETPWAPGTLERYRRKPRGRTWAIRITVVSLGALVLWAAIFGDLSVLPSLHH